MRFLNVLFLTGICLCLCSSAALAAVVQGHIYLQNASDHSGVQVVLSPTIEIPSTSIIGIVVLLLLGSILLYKTRPYISVSIIVLLLTITSVSLTSGMKRYSTQTNADGYYIFNDVDMGRYELEAQKSCYLDYVLDELAVDQENMTLDDIELSELAGYNESYLPDAMYELKRAQSEYQKYSYLHTYTGNLACLCSGNGSNGWGFLSSDFSDGIVHGYQIQVAVGDQDDHNTYWSWSAAAVPVDYGCTGVKSYYIDDRPGPAEDLFAGDMGGAPGDDTMPVMCLQDPENAMYDLMKALFKAENRYNNYSSPHTYTGTLACLCSGNGSGGFSYVSPGYADGETCGYKLALEHAATPDVIGSYWSWSCTAWPVTYGEGSTRTFHVDESGVVRAEDIGGGPGTSDMLCICPDQSPMDTAQDYMNAIVKAETDYNNYSNPHTYTGSLACLCSGNGAGFCSFLIPDLRDGLACGYRYAMTQCETPAADGTYWCWSCTAWPVTYGEGSTRTFHVDESGVVRAEDIGGGPGTSDMPCICPNQSFMDTAADFMDAIAQAETDYNDNSNPHTYTGSLACLCSGNGAGGCSFLRPDLRDGLACGYRYAMTQCATPDANGSYWCWSCTAWPVVYNSDTFMTFWIDESGILRGADVNGGPGTTNMPAVCSPLESVMAYAIENLKAIARAETDYNNNSSPHTYTGSLACLCTGNGAGGVSLLNPLLADNEACYYYYSMGAGIPDAAGGIWSWSCTAWPIHYGNVSFMTYYIDETSVVRGANQGGGPGDDSMHAID